MSKIIKITESQLKDIVGRVISEQFPTPQMGYADPFATERAQQGIKSKERWEIHNFKEKVIGDFSVFFKENPEKSYYV